MNVVARNVTENITDACYDLTVKQKLAKSKPSKRVWKLGCQVLITLLSVERRKNYGKENEEIAYTVHDPQLAAQHVGGHRRC